MTRAQTPKKSPRSSWLWALVALMAAVFAYHSSPWYWLSEAVYWEALKQSRVEQGAIRHVIANRLAAGRSEWGDSLRAVILSGENRGINRDFTYRHHHDRWWIPSWAPIVPYAHATRRGNWETWMVINWDTAWFLLGHYTGLGEDPTSGATFYVVDGRQNKWFNNQISSGFLCPTGKIDAHIFYRLCNVSLNGSPESVGRAYRYAKRAGYDFAQTGEEIARLAAGRWWSDPTVASIDGMKNVRLSGVSYPYLLPEAATYLRRLAAEYAAACGDEPLVVTSAMRPLNEGRRNSLPRSVHPTGMAMDLSTTSNRCGKWLEEALLRGERAGFVDVTKEQRPPHYHVVVFPGQYTKWLAKTP